MGHHVMNAEDSRDDGVLEEMRMAAKKLSATDFRFRAPIAVVPECKIDGSRLGRSDASG